MNYELAALLSLNSSRMCGFSLVAQFLQHLPSRLCMARKPLAEAAEHRSLPLHLLR